MPCNRCNPVRPGRLLTLLGAAALSACSAAPKAPAPGAALPPCGSFPNCVNSESGKGSAAIAPLAANAAQWQSLKDWLAEQADWTIEKDSGDFLQAVVKTPLMRFRDDVQLLFLPQSDTIQVRSSSRLGISDMGTNRKRVEMLRAHLRGE